MPLKTLVKVGHITNLSDARYCAGMGVEMLGFSAVTGNENFIDPKKYQEIRGWVSGPAVVAEIYGLKMESLPEVMENYAPDYLELTVTDLANLPAQISTNLILRVDEKAFIGYNDIINSYKNQISYLIVDQTENSTDFVKTISDKFSVLLTPQPDVDIISLLDSSPVKGLSLNGSMELKPGLKDYDHLAEVLEALDVD